MILPESLFAKFGKTYVPGQIIFCEFEPGQDVFFIQEGRVKIIKTIGNSQKTLDVLKKGDFFGEMAMLEQEPRSATAIAIDTVKVLSFNRENFHMLLQGLPVLVWNLLVIFSTRIYDAKRRLEILCQEDLEARVADVFVMLAEKDPRFGQESRMKFNVVPEDVAHWCAQPETVVHDIIKKFSTQGKIEIFSDHMIVSNINDLMRLVSLKKKQPK